MTRDEAVTEIQTRLGFRTDQSANIILRMKMVQRLLEQGRTLPWFLEESTTTAVAANGDLTFPTGFIREIREPTRLGVYYRDSDNAIVRLTKMDDAEASAAFGQGDGTASPSAYSLGSTSFIFYPRQHVALDVTVKYYKHDTVLDTNIQNAWLANAPDLIIGNAGASFAETLQNTSAYNECSQLAQVAWAALLAEKIEREIAGRQYILGRNN